MSEPNLLLTLCLSPVQLLSRFWEKKKKKNLLTTSLAYMKLLLGWEDLIVTTNPEIELRHLLS